MPTLDCSPNVSPSNSSCSGLPAADEGAFVPDLEGSAIIKDTATRGEVARIYTVLDL